MFLWQQGLHRQLCIVLEGFIADCVSSVHPQALPDAACKGDYSSRVETSDGAQASILWLPRSSQETTHVQCTGSGCESSSRARVAEQCVRDCDPDELGRGLWMQSEGRAVTGEV